MTKEVAMRYNLEKMLLTTIVIVSAFAWTAPSQALIFRRPLEGIGEVGIVIDKLPADAVTLNITEHTLRNTVLTLLNRNLPELKVTDSAPVDLSVSLALIQATSKAGSYLGYYSHLLVRAVDYVRVPYPSVEAPEFYRFAKALVWERRVLFGGSSKDAWGQLENILTETMGRFAADYRHDNPGFTKGE
jgi:hypothetical protein